MSGSSSGSGGEGTNAAEAEFQRYKARMAGQPMMVPMMMAPGMGPGWAMPPSLAALGPAGYPATGAAGQTGGSIGERLGTTLRLGIEFLNTLLASGAGTLGSTAAMLPQGSYGGGCGCGCGGDCGCGCGSDCGCGYDCCTVMGCGCCQPGLSGCCR